MGDDVQSGKRPQKRTARAITFRLPIDVIEGFRTYASSLGLTYDETAARCLAPFAAAARRRLASHAAVQAREIAAAGYELSRLFRSIDACVIAGRQIDKALIDEAVELRRGLAEALLILRRTYDGEVEQQLQGTADRWGDN